jgi:hypothetical protein
VDFVVERVGGAMNFPFDGELGELGDWDSGEAMWTRGRAGKSPFKHSFRPWPSCYTGSPFLAS